MAPKAPKCSPQNLCQELPPLLIEGHCFNSTNNTVDKNTKTMAGTEPKSKGAIEPMILVIGRANHVMVR